MLVTNKSEASSPLSEDSFHAMVSEWELATGLTSDLTEMSAHPAFRRIVDSGRAAIPFLLRELKADPSFLVLALGEITGENPVPRSAKGKVKEMAKAWLAWGERNGYCDEAQ
jgi:hypothetical protein